MIQYLQLGAVDRVAQKAAHMVEIDPSGLTLTLVSVSVVFGALLILFGAYTITGKIFTREAKTSGPAGSSAEEAAAVAVALDLFLSQEGGASDEQAAAIAVALDRFLEEESVHDIESGIITIKR